MKFHTRKQSPWISGFLILLMNLSVSAAPSTPSEFYEDAQSRYTEGEHNAAIIQLKNALKLDSEHLPARLLLGRVYLSKEDGANAEKELRVALASGADENLVLVPLAKAYLLQGKHKQIFDKFPAGRRHPETESALAVIRGETRVQLRQLKEADIDFTLAARLTPDSADPIIGKATVLLQRGDHEGAEDLADEATSIAPESAGAWYVKGEIRRIRQDLEGAIQYYDKALALYEKHFRARIGKTAALLDLGRKEEAITELELVRDRHPYDPQASYLHAMVLAQADQLAEAQAVLRTAGITLLSKGRDFLFSHPPSLLLSAVIHHAEGKYDSAYEEIQRFMKLVPHHVGGRILLGNLLIRRGKHARAIKTLEQALRFAPKNAQLHGLLGNAYMGTRDFSKATRYFEDAARLAPDLASLRTQLALSRLATGQRASAVADLETAFGLDSSGRSGVLLGTILLKQGNFPEALKSTLRTLKHQPTNPTAHNLLATILLARGKTKAASQAFNQAIAVDARYLPARYNLAKIDIAAGRLKEAKARYLEILRLAPAETRAMEELARMSKDTGQLPGAIRWLEKLQAMDSNQLSAQLDLGELYLQAGKPKKALILARQLEQKHPRSLPILTALGRAELASGAKDKAKVTFRRMTKFAGFAADNLLRISRYQIAVNDFDGAHWSLLKALEGKPGYLPVLTAMVRVELRLGKYKEALKRAHGLQQSHPKNSVGELLAGDTLMAMKRYKEALNTYQAGQVKKASPILVVRLYKAHKSSGQLTQGLKLVERWLAAHPTDHEVRRALASGYGESKRSTEAIREHERLIKALPNDAAILNNLANLYLQNNDARALYHAERAYQLAPKQAAALDTYGWVLVQMGEPGKALRFLREARSRAARRPGILYHLAVALNRLGRDKESKRELTALLKYKESFAERSKAEALARKLEKK